MDGLTAIAKSTSETASYFVDENNFITETLEKILTVLEDTAKSNTINEKSSKNSSSLSEEIDKRKKINSSLKTGAKNVSDMKSDISDRIGAVVIVSTLNDGFRKTINALNIQTKTLQGFGKNIKEKPQKITSPNNNGMFKSFEKTLNGIKSNSASFIKTFGSAISSLKNIPNAIVTPFKNISSGIGKAIVKPFAAIKDGFTKTFDGFKSFFLAIPQKFSKLFGGVKNFFGKIFTKKDKKAEGKGDISAVAIFAGDTLDASQFIKSFNKIIKDINKMKSIDTKKLEQSSKDIKKWADSFNKEILSIKIDQGKIRKFEGNLKTALKAIDSINFSIIKSVPLTKLSSSFYKKGDEFKGLNNFSTSLNNAIDSSNVDSKKVAKISSELKISSESINSAQASIIKCAPLSGIVNLLYRKERGFSGIENWISSASKIKLPRGMNAQAFKVMTDAISSIATSIFAIQKTILSNISFGLRLAIAVKFMTFNGIKNWIHKVDDAFKGLGPKKASDLASKVKPVADIAKSIKDISVNVVLSFIPMKLLNVMFKSEKTPIFNGIKNYLKALDTNLIESKEMPNAAKAKKVSRQVVAVSDVAKHVKNFAMSALKMSLALFVTGGLLNKLKNSTIKSLTTISEVMSKVGESVNEVSKIKFGKVAAVTGVCILLVPYFTAMTAALIPMGIATVFAIGVNKLKPNLVFTDLVRALSTMLNRLATLKKELAWGILSLALLITFSTLLLVATTLLILALPLALGATLGLVAVGVMFLGLFLVSKVASMCLKGIPALIGASIALAIMGIAMYVAIKALAEVSKIIMETGPGILLSLAAVAILFGICIGLGAISGLVIAGAAALALASIAVAIAGFAILSAVKNLAETSTVIQNNEGIAMSLLKLALIFGALAVTGVAATAAAVFMPGILASALLLIPAAIAMKSALEHLAEIEVDGLATKTLGLAPIFLAIVPVSVAAVAAAVACVPLAASMLMVNSTFQYVFEKFAEMSKAASAIDASGLDRGMKAIANLTGQAVSIKGNVKSLKEVFKGLKKGIKAAPSKKEVSKFVKAINGLKEVDMNAIGDMTSSFNKSFASLSSSKEVINDLSSTIHSLNKELTELSKQKGSVKILKDIQGNSGSSVVSDIKSKLFGNSSSNNQAPNSGGKSIDDLYDLLSQINNKIEGKKVASWNS